MDCTRIYTFWLFYKIWAYRSLSFKGFLIIILSIYQCHVILVVLFVWIFVPSCPSFLNAKVTKILCRGVFKAKYWLIKNGKIRKLGHFSKPAIATNKIIGTLRHVATSPMAIVWNIYGGFQGKYCFTWIWEWIISKKWIIVSQSVKY